MKKTLTFIIPVRHQDNAKDWGNLKNNLASTVRSISSQTNGDWRAIIVANHGADLPVLPDGFEVNWVDFPPNRLHEQGLSDQEQFYEAIRIDKGRRVLSGMLHAGEMKHVMIVDDDDFVSNRLTAFVAVHPKENGWYIRDGYVWGEDSHILYRFADFSKLCGTCYVIRADLYSLPKAIDDATDLYIRQMLGSHIFIRNHLASQNTPLAPLPFVGAVYRVGHAGSHSQSKGVFSQYFPRWLVKQPVELCLRLSRLKYLSTSIRKEYFGQR